MIAAEIKPHSPPTNQALSLLLSAVPRIIGFIVIVAIGWFIATLIARAVACPTILSTFLSPRKWILPCCL